MIKINLDNSKISEEVNLFSTNTIDKIHKQIHNKTGRGNDFLGWVDWPKNYNKQEYELMKKVAKNLREQVKILVVIGIGGSYLGPRAADEMIRGLYPADDYKLIYVGNSISSTYLQQVLNYVQGKEYAIVNISKSGTTTEPGVAFRIFENDLIKHKDVEVAKKRIIAVTDQKRGALKKLADNKGYQTFVIPDDIGGRFSVTTPVGIFCLLFAGINCDEMFAGAQKAMKDLSKIDNDAYKYAIARHLLNIKKNYNVEMLITYETQMQMFVEWWKQLFGESEGKENKGILPDGCVFTTDLHSLGQFIQDGVKNVLFETIIKVKQPLLDLKIPFDEQNLDELNYLTDKTVHEINNTAMQGTINAHASVAKIPNIILEFEKMDAEMFGYATYWFFKAVAMSAYLLDINPFDQPGVEIYKTNMFKLLKKPGY